MCGALPQFFFAEDIFKNICTCHPEEPRSQINYIKVYAQTLVRGGRFVTGVIIDPVLAFPIGSYEISSALRRKCRSWSQTGCPSLALVAGPPGPVLSSFLPPRPQPLRSGNVSPSCRHALPSPSLRRHVLHSCPAAT